VINIASGWAFRGAVNKHVAYGVAKAGMVQLTRMIAMSYARDGVRCHCVAPGTFPFRANEEARQAIGRGQPAGRPGDPDELAALVAFLCTDAAEFVTGEMISSDGGARIGGLIPAEMIPQPEQEYGRNDV
jgi:3-oxoacyl-[acyl-carrier protein] reductase